MNIIIINVVNIAESHLFFFDSNTFPVLYNYKKAGPLLPTEIKLSLTFFCNWGHPNAQHATETLIFMYMALLSPSN